MRGRNMKKLNESKYSLAIAAFCGFLIMFVCNCMMHLFADDFVFVNQYGSWKRMTNYFQIIPSLQAIYQSENGRIVAHFFVQTFLFLPPVIFKVLNAVAFVVEIYLMYRLALDEHPRSTFLFAILFGSVWIFQPAFGETNIWLTGSCNYLWGSIFNLLFISHFINKFLHQRDFHCISAKIAFVIFAFLVGDYSENASLATLIIVIALLAFSAYKNHDKIQAYQILSVVALAVGFLFLMTSPAELRNKFAPMNLYIFLENFVRALDVYNQLRILLVVFVSLYTLGVFCKLNPNKLICVGILFLGSLCSNFAVAFAEYYPDRSAFYSAILLIVACAILFQELIDTKYQEMVTCLGVVALLFSLYYGIIGVQDMYKTHCFFARNEQVMEEARQNGITELQLPMPYRSTKYSPTWGFPYLSAREEAVYPNKYMAIYYGFDKLIGVPEW